MKRRSKERTQFLADIITTAVEGGTGYWAYTSGYKWSEEKPEIAEATLTEMEAASADEKVKSGKLTVDSIAAALGRIRRGEIKMGHQYLDWILGDDRENGDRCMIDAECADIIAQVVVLGDIVYG
jgi:hypothetical protein